MESDPARSPPTFDDPVFAPEPPRLPPYLRRMLASPPSAPPHTAHTAKAQASYTTAAQSTEKIKVRRGTTHRSLPSMSDFAQLAAKAKEEGVVAAAAAAAASASDAPAAAAAATPEAADDAAAGDAGAAAPEEESTAQFEPVVQLEEVEVKTHEEDEEVLWKM